MKTIPLKKFIPLVLGCNRNTISHEYFFIIYFYENANKITEKSIIFLNLVCNTIVILCLTDDNITLTIHKDNSCSLNTMCTYIEVFIRDHSWKTLVRYTNRGNYNLYLLILRFYYII